MDKFYTDEVNAQIIIALLKANGIRKIVASPGTTNIPITGSVQNDPFFEVYSSVDERSAAYMACGMAHASGEAVVLTCTGATASRNYLPGMTEAYYRKLPVIAITSTASLIECGHLLPQCIDRSVIPCDVANLSISLPPVKDQEDFWNCEIKVNQAILEATRSGGGPVHINLVTSYMKTFNTRTLPEVRAIRRFEYHDTLPELDVSKKIAVFIGAHSIFTDELSHALDSFAKTHNAVFFCDHTSSYKGYAKIVGALPMSQRLHENPIFSQLKPELIIHIGEISGDYPSQGFLATSEAPVWRVSQDGELRDRFRNLNHVFNMREQDFFNKYSNDKNTIDTVYLSTWNKYVAGIRTRIPEIPFSNTWIAQKLSDSIPKNSIIHFGILNSLRNWNLYNIHDSISTACNVGGFGIDGCVSTLFGSALANIKKLNFGIIGDLAFFYDLNSIGNKHIPKNLRILMINNGGGCEFELSSHFGSQFGEQTGDFISAGGHFGSKSSLLIKHYAENLGFKYITANSKETFIDSAALFVSETDEWQPIIFECFTDSQAESLALELMTTIDTTPQPSPSQQSVAKKIIKQSLNKTVQLMLKTMPWSVRCSLKEALK
jgi:2-succinyl-5-enolpyruvyl-6-hydroxy-3-cyclohexene-1-carboxylate synthase